MQGQLIALSRIARIEDRHGVAAGSHKLGEEKKFFEARRHLYVELDDLEEIEERSDDARLHSTLGDLYLRFKSKRFKEAEALRLDAESLKAEYEAKLADAAKESDEMRARADAEAEALVTKAKADATALIARRKQMAEERKLKLVQSFI